MNIFIGENGTAYNLKYAQYLYIDHPSDWQVKIQWGMDPFPQTVIAEFANETDARAAVIRISSDEFVTYGELDGTI